MPARSPIGPKSATAKGEVSTTSSCMAVAVGRIEAEADVSHRRCHVALGRVDTHSRRELPAWS